MAPWQDPEGEKVLKDLVRKLGAHNGKIASKTERFLQGG